MPLVVGDPVQPSSIDHFMNVPAAPRKSILPDGPGPPLKGTSVSAVPRNESSLIGRDGLQGSSLSMRRSNDDGVTAAKTSAALHARYCDIPPPIENPVEYTCFGSMQALPSIAATIPLAKPRSSTVREFVQHGPMFQALSIPFGQAMTKPWLSDKAANPESDFSPEPVPPSGWKSRTSGTGDLPL